MTVAQNIYDIIEEWHTDEDAVEPLSAWMTEVVMDQADAENDIHFLQRVRAIEARYLADEYGQNDVYFNRVRACLPENQ